MADDSRFIDKKWIRFDDDSLVNLDFVMKVRIDHVAFRVIFHHPVTPGSTSGGATQAVTYANDAAAIAAFEKVTSLLDRATTDIRP